MVQLSKKTLFFNNFGSIYMDFADSPSLNLRNPNDIIKIRVIYMYTLCGHKLFLSIVHSRK